MSGGMRRGGVQQSKKWPRCPMCKKRHWIKAPCQEKPKQ